MSRSARDFAWSSEVLGAEKLVLLCLAEYADDEGRCWPSVATIAKRCGLGRRTVMRKLAELENTVHISRQISRGRPTRYHLNLSHPGTSASVAPVPTDAPTGANGASDKCHQVPRVVSTTTPNPSRTVTKPLERVERAVRGTRLPENFELTPERRKVAEAHGLSPERVFAKFICHWRSASGRNARKLNWDEAWCKWCLDELDFRSNRGADQEAVAKRRIKDAQAAALDREIRRAAEIGCPLTPHADDTADSYATSVQLWRRDNKRTEPPPPRFVTQGAR